MPTITTNCKGCQKEFTTYRSPSYLERHKELYCSRACFEVHWAKAYLFVCEECSREFTACITPDRPNPRFCSRECRNKNIDAIVDYVCQECGKTFRLQRSLKRKYCSKSCAGKHSYVVSRNPKPIYGNCQRCGNQLSASQRYEGGLFCSKACYYAFRIGLTNEQYAAMIEGVIVNDLPDSYRGPNWSSQRKNARRRDNYCCQRCGISESELYRQLDVHHIKPFHTFDPADYRRANALENLVCLCNLCHRQTEAFDLS